MNHRTERGVGGGGGFTVSPSLEQIWSDEVRYLHSLWHIGPPSSSTSSNPNIPVPLGVSTQIMKKKPKKKKKKKKINVELNPPPQPVSDIPWPEPPVQAPQTGATDWQNGTGWGNQLKNNTNSITTTTTIRPVSAEEVAKVTAMQVQQKGLRASEEFFMGLRDSDDDDDGEEEDDLMEEEDGGEEQVLNFFLGVFKEDSELRGYYEKNYESGEFCCLVCWGNRQKLNKKFKNCVALVQHSTTVSKTKWMRAHRAFGQAICKVLGWEINRLPSIVLSLGEPLSRELAQNNAQVGTKENDDNVVAESNPVSDIPWHEPPVQSPQTEADWENRTGWDNQVLSTAGSATTTTITMTSPASAELAQVTACKGNQVLSTAGSATTTTTTTTMTSPASAELAQVTACKGNQVLSTAGSATTTTMTSLASAELAQVTALQAQQKGLRACEEFFLKSQDSDEDEGGEEHKDDLMEDDAREEEVMNFFLGLFKEGSELRGYYEKNCESGEFCCLVCWGNRQKLNKKFKNCVALVQHSTTVSKTKWRAHRAFGQAVCKVLGWDINQLPSIVLCLGKPLSRELTQQNAQKNDNVVNEDGSLKDEVHDKLVDAEKNASGYCEVDTEQKDDNVVNENDTQKDEDHDKLVDAENNASVDCEGQA